MTRPLPLACSVHIFLYMRKDLRTAFIGALELARATIGDIGEAIGRSYRALMSYRSGERRVTPDAARLLAGYLRSRSEMFTAAADELDAAAQKEEKSDA